MPVPGGEVAGIWGSYLCDMPYHSFQSMLDFIVADIKPDMFFWTGDNSAHDVWENTEQEITQYTVDISNMLSDSFKDTGITVIPI
jgi:hypothetical protein